MADEQKDEQKVEFTAQQQAVIDKLIGDARVKAREKAGEEAAASLQKTAADAELASMAAEKKWQELAAKHEARVKELEPLEVQAKAYTELISGMLKDKIKSLGEAAKTAVAALPSGLSDADKLAWVSKNEGLFTTSSGVGTPKRAKQAAAKGEIGKPEITWRL